MAIYFLNGWGEVEKRSFNCVFCGGVFEERSLLNTHYFEAHIAVFSEEELALAGVGMQRAHRTQRISHSPRP